jgi:hypothetical protein
MVIVDDDDDDDDDDGGGGAESNPAWEGFLGTIDMLDGRRGRRAISTSISAGRYRVPVVFSSS